MRGYTLVACSEEPDAVPKFFLLWALLRDFRGDRIWVYNLDKAVVDCEVVMSVIVWREGADTTDHCRPSGEAANFGQNNITELIRGVVFHSL